MSDAMMASAGVAGPQVGLHAAGGPVPLEGVHIAAVMDGPCLQVTVRQRYRNTEAVPIEAVYVFPLPEDAAVCGFRARFGDEWVEGRVQEREKAYTTYDDALLDGRTAALLDQERPNVFTASLGNLPPGQGAVVEIRYVARLRWEGAGYRLTFPTTVSPRYVPAQPPEVGQPEGERVNPERWLAVPYGLQFDLRVGSGGLRSVESPSHPVRVSLTDEGAEVALAQESVALDRDLVVLVQQKAAATPTAVATTAPDGSEVVLLDFLPDLPASEHAPREVVFLLDCSGSMDGSSIEEAKRALQLCVRALRLGDTFDIVRFGSRHESLWQVPKAYDDTTLAHATAWLAATHASLGGTEIRAPLEFILKRPVPAGRPRSVVLLTDGQVSNEADVIALAARHAGTTSIFAFGIGAGASDHLVRGVARAGRGEAEMIFPGERIEPKVLRTFARLRSLRFVDVRLETRDPDAQLAPRELPPLFPGMPFSLLARYPGRAPSTLVLAAGEHRWDVPVRRAAAVHQGRAGIAPISLCWARERIRDLEAPRQSGSRQQRVPSSGEARAELVMLGEAYGLLSSATSYVAVSTSVMAAGLDAELRHVPVALTAGWGGNRRAGGHTSMRLAAPATLSVADSEGDDMNLLSMRESDGLSRLMMDLEPRMSASRLPPVRRRSASMDSRKSSLPDVRTRVTKLLMTQTAGGRFPYSDALEAELGPVMLLLEPWKTDDVVVTVVVLHLLNQRYGAFADETRAAREKAEASMTADEANAASQRARHILSVL